MLILRVVLFVAGLILSWLMNGNHSNAQWGSGACRPSFGQPGMFVSAPQYPMKAYAPEYEWKRTPGGNWFLMDGERVVGGYDPVADHYLAWDGRAWATSPSTPPIKTPPATAKQKDTPEGSKVIGGVLNYGVDLKQLSHDGVYTIKGVQVTPTEARQALDNGKLTDDSSKWCITVISADHAQRAAIRKDLESTAFAEFAPKIRLQSLPPDHWMMAPYQLGRDNQFKKSGVAIFVQPPAGPDGKAKAQVLYEYKGVPALIASLRTIDPNYDPNKTPPAGPDSGTIDLSKVGTGTWVLLAVIAAGVLIYFHGKNQQV